jgi:hypothetical protein
MNTLPPLVKVETIIDMQVATIFFNTSKVSKKHIGATIHRKIIPHAIKPISKQLI